MAREKKNKDEFEKSLNRLQKIVEQLEQGNLPLEKMIELFEEGAKLKTFCRKKLEAARGRVRILLDGEEGEPTESSFDEY
jgi:exodeoxyribonuclease VII small subunit